MELIFESLPETRDWAKKMSVPDHVKISTLMWNGYLSKRCKDWGCYEGCINHVNNYGVRDRTITFFHSDLAKVVDKIESIIWNPEPNSERMKLKL